MTYDGCTIDHVLKLFPKPTPSVSVYCRQSKIGYVEDVGGDLTPMGQYLWYHVTAVYVNASYISSYLSCTL